MLLSTSCAASEGGCSAPDDIIGVSVPSGEPQPRRDEWRLELYAPFDAEAVTRISIGGREEADNFANRGDVVVRFDGEPGRILVEMRRFDFTRDPDSAFERLELWTHRLDDGLWPPQDPSDGVCAERWDLDCGVRVHYDGQTQAAASGADLRVTLPPEFDGHVQVVTEDADTEAYVNRADVCMLGLRGTADVVLGSGRAWLSLARDVHLVPGCNEEDEVACETADPPWQWDCPCLEPQGFGAASVWGARTDLMVSVPAGLWTLEYADNEWPCERSVERAPENAPAGAPAAGGYMVQAMSEECGLVEHFDSPADWRDSEQPESEQRGHVEICRDCLFGARCDELIH